MNIEVSPRSRKDIRDLTFRLRKAFNYDNRLFFPIVDFLEKGMSLIFNDFEYEYVSDREMEEGLEGLTVPKDNKIVIPESIMILAVHGDGRARFTFAHEIGHYFLHRHEKQGFARQRCCNIPTYCSSEMRFLLVTHQYSPFLFDSQ